jgi:hypothetical protein
MKTKTLYRDSCGLPVSAEQVRSNPDAREKTYRFSMVRPMPTVANVIGTVGGVPVIHVTDLGGCIHTDAMREVAFMLPGDNAAHGTLLDADCEIPRHRSWSDRIGANSPFRKSGYFLVLHVTDETWLHMDKLPSR